LLRFGERDAARALLEIAFPETVLPEIDLERLGAVVALSGHVLLMPSVLILLYAIVGHGYERRNVAAWMETLSYKSNKV
jgi:hypothetical protein